MKILITGGAGFIGSHMCDQLYSEGNTIIVIDNLELGKMENINHLLNSKNFVFIKSDLCNYSELEKIFEEQKFDMVYHLAANSDIQKGGMDSTVDLNNTFLSTLNILRCMAKYNTNKLFFASSSAIYGESQEELHENYGPLLPISNYGAGKLASEGFISSFSATYNIKTWIARFPNVVGERFTHGVIYDFIHKLKLNPEILQVLGNGEQCKPYVYVKDIINGIQFIINNAKETLNIYNLGTETRSTVKDIAKIVIEEMGVPATIQYTGGTRGWIGDVPEFRYKLDKIHTLGWKAKYSSNEAVRLAIQKALTEQK